MRKQKPKPKTSEPRVLLWDIEATGLNASFGTILCIGYKWLGDAKPQVLTILDGGSKDFLNDKKVVQKFADVYRQSDYHVTWYGDRYDLPMVHTKLLKHGLNPLPPKPSVDLWKCVRYRFKLHNNRLNSWQQYLKTPNAKTAIEFDAWLAAAHGDKKAMKEVTHHCSQDVLALEDMFLKLRPWISNEPNRALFTGEVHACPSCGGSLVRQGFKMAVTRRYQQWQCKSCGRWTRTVAADPLKMEHRASAS